MLATLFSLSWRRLLLIGTAALAALLLTAWPTLAHANLKTASVLPDAVVTSALTTLTLTFTEETSPTQTRVTVTNAGGQRVDKNDLKVAGDTATIGLNPLVNGVYTVTYRTFVEEDSHLVDGEFRFTVAQSGATAGDVSKVVRQVQSTLPAAAPKGGAGGMARDANADAATLATLVIGFAFIVAATLWTAHRRSA